MSTQLFPVVQPEAAPVAVAALPMAREVKWDFQRGLPVYRQGVPVYVEGAEAVLTWAWHALRTVRYRHEILSWAYGCELEELIGKPYTEALKQSEGRRYVEEALSVNPYISGVAEVAVGFADGLLSIECRITTIYGEVRVNV